MVYTPVEDVTPKIKIASQWVFLITTWLTAAILLAAWVTSSRVSKTNRLLSGYAGKIGDGSFDSFSSHSHIREINTLTEAMNQMAVQLQKADQTQKSFLQNASHELRTPLMSIRGYAEGIECGVLKDNKKDAAIVVKESIRLTELVNQMLTLTHMESLNHHADLQPINLYDFLSGYMDSLNGIAIANEVIWVKQSK